MRWTKLHFFKTDKWSELKELEGLPSHKARLRAFQLTPFNKVKVVILGQDPYPTKGHANGLAFSVLPHVKPLPASLRNVLKEYHKDLGHPIPRSGDLSNWAREGVLLLNTVLSCPEGRPLGHVGIGWEKLTYEALSRLSYKRDSIVWMLWGAKAQEYRGLIDEDRHLVLASGHPSPLARGAKVPFVGSKPFSKANEYLLKHNISPVNWRLP